jgi:hypothetical protein
VRISTALIIVVVLGAGGYGLYKLGHATDKPANEIFTVASVPREASIAAAEANLAGAVSAANSYKLDHSSYAGMSAGDLRGYDKALAPGIDVRTATSTAYCIESTVSGTTVSIRGPNGTFAVRRCSRASSR